MSTKTTYTVQATASKHYLYEIEAESRRDAEQAALSLMAVELKRQEDAEDGIPVHELEQEADPHMKGHDIAAPETMDTFDADEVHRHEQAGTLHEHAASVYGWAD